LWSCCSLEDTSINTYNTTVRMVYIWACPARHTGTLLAFTGVLRYPRVPIGDRDRWSDYQWERRDSMAGALDGVRVIDFGQWLAGPLTALLLADQGAEVIHVDPPGGPRWKTVANATLQRGKQRVVLDLKRTADLASARSLISSA